MKRSISLSYLNTLLIVLLIVVILIPLAYSNYKIYENSMNNVRKNLLQDSVGITQVILEQEGFILKKSIYDISKHLSKLNIEDIEHQKLSKVINNDIFYNDLDLIFIDNKKEMIDLSVSVYDTESIISALKSQSYSLDENCIYNIKVDDKVYSVLLIYSEIMNKDSGKSIGKIYLGKILNNNFELLNSIRSKINSDDVSLYLLGDIISTTLIKDSSEYKRILSLDSLSKNSNIYETDDKIYLKQEIVCKDVPSGLYLISSYKNDTFKTMKENLYLQMAVLIIVFLFIGIVINYIMKKLVIEPIDRLVSFAHQLKEKKNITFDVSYIKELNYIHDEIKSIIDELRGVKEQYTLAVDGSQEGLWDWDIRTNKVFYSKRFNEMLGFENGELGDTIDAWASRISERDYDIVKKRMIKHFKGIDPYYSIDYKMITKDGSIKWIRSRGKALFDKDGRAYRMVGFHTDIDEIKRLERENIEKERTILQNSKMVALGEIMTNIAHHWRQPLSVITTAATGLKLKFEFNIFDRYDAIKDLDIVNSTAQSLSKVIDNFSNIYNLEEKKVEFDINNVIENKLILFNADSKNNDINIIHRNEDEINFYGDKDEFILIISNIINNSIDTLLENEELEKKIILIDTYLENVNLIVNIRDNGGGINREIKDRIFEPYFTTHHQSQGKGLGLYIAREIILKSFDGKIEFRNVNFVYENIEYRGAEFTLIFPIKSEELEL